MFPFPNDFLRRMSRLATDEAVKSQFEAETGLSLHDLGPRQRSNYELTKAHQLNLEEQKEMMQEMVTRGCGVLGQTASGSKPAVAMQHHAPAAAAAASLLASCTPISVAELHAGTTHRGRVLRGRVMTSPLAMNSVMTLLEDERGDLVKVGT